MQEIQIKANPFCFFRDNGRCHAISTTFGTWVEIAGVFLFAVDAASGNNEHLQEVRQNNRKNWIAFTHKNVNLEKYSLIKM